MREFYGVMDISYHDRSMGYICICQLVINYTLKICALALFVYFP